VDAAIMWHPVNLVALFNRSCTLSEHVQRQLEVGAGSLVGTGGAGRERPRRARSQGFRTRDVRNDFYG